MPGCTKAVLHLIQKVALGSNRLYQQVAVVFVILKGKAEKVGLHVDKQLDSVVVRSLV